MNGVDEPEDPVRRLSTGSPGLDTVLNGGWIHGGTYMVSGPPGTGKTILGNQLCFSHVAGGGRAVFVTMLSESHGRMMTHLRRMRFFQREFIGTSLHYVSGYATLKAEGLDGLARLLYRSVREHQASVLVVDGMLAVQESAGTALAFREFLHALGVHNALAGCTTLVLTNRHELASDPQFAMVDGVLVLELQRWGLKAVRTLEVTKLRGEAQLTGQHTFEINTQGLVIYPRLESLYPTPPEEAQEPGLPAAARRRGFGLPRLDQMLTGGLPALSSTLLLGSPGSSKTLLGLHFLAQGAQQAEAGLYYGFMETRPRLLAKADGVGLALRPAVDSGRLVLETHAAVEALPDMHAHALLARVERHQVRRLVLDGLGSFLLQSMEPRRTLDFITALTNALRSRGVTSLLVQSTQELPGLPLDLKLRGLESLVDNVVLLRCVELRSQLYRMLSILKMRESDYESALREFSISTRGIHLAEDSSSAEAILTGKARPTRARPPPPRRSSPSTRTPPRRRSRA